MTMSADRRDFLDEIIDERRKRNPGFPDLVEAALIDGDVTKRAGRRRLDSS